MRLRDLAHSLGITERGARGIVTDLSGQLGTGILGIAQASISVTFG